MELYGIEFDYTGKPELEDDFVPIALWNAAYLSGARESFTIAISAPHHCIIHRTRVRNNNKDLAADRFYLERLVKTLLWLYGGYRVSITGSQSLFAHLQEVFSPSGTRYFDVAFMQRIYNQAFVVELLPAPPEAFQSPQFMAKHLNGYRIGFDAGGNDRKVTAVSNGKVVYSEEVLWYPVQEPDPDYHYKAIVEAMLSAAKKLPRIDAIGISSAGIHLNNQIRLSSMFRSVPEDQHDELRKYRGGK